MFSSMLASIPGTVLKVIATALIGFNCGLASDVTDVLDTKKIDYEFVKLDKSVMGLYIFKSGKIQIAKRYQYSPMKLRYVAAHELIHKVRVENDIYHNNDPLFDEYLAIYGAERVSILMGFGELSVSERGYLKATQRSHGAKVRRLTDKEMQEVEHALVEVFELIKKL